jgi:hypothetical protein
VALHCHLQLLAQRLEEIFDLGAVALTYVGVRVPARLWRPHDWRHSVPATGTQAPTILMRLNPHGLPRYNHLSTC